MRMILSLEESPATISTLRLGTSKSFAKNLLHSSFALPSTGGAAILSFSAPAYSPAISVFEARGWARTLKVTAPFFSATSITLKSRSADKAGDDFGCHLHQD